MIAKSIFRLSDVSSNEGAAPRQEATAIPPSWTALDIPNRNEIFGRVYNTDSHELVPVEHGKIFVIVIDMSTEAMKTLFICCVNFLIPRTAQERQAVGKPHPLIHICAA